MIELTDKPLMNDSCDSTDDPRMVNLGSFVISLEGCGLVCTACDVRLELPHGANLLDAIKIARDHHKAKRLAMGAYCPSHRSRVDEQQAEQTDRCNDCGRTRPEHCNQCRVCGKPRSKVDEIAWRDELFCSVACLTRRQEQWSRSMRSA